VFWIIVGRVCQIRGQFYTDVLELLGVCVFDPAAWKLDYFSVWLVHKTCVAEQIFKVGYYLAKKWTEVLVARFSRLTV